MSEEDLVTLSKLERWTSERIAGLLHSDETVEAVVEFHRAVMNDIEVIERHNELLRSMSYRLPVKGLILPLESAEIINQTPNAAPAPAC